MKPLLDLDFQSLQERQLPCILPTQSIRPSIFLGHGEEEKDDLLFTKRNSSRLLNFREKRQSDWTGAGEIWVAVVVPGPDNVCRGRRVIWVSLVADIW